MQQHLTLDDPLGPFVWNEAQSGPVDDLNGLLVTLIAVGPENMFKVLGTGFVIVADGRFATAMTATHVLLDGAQFQTPTTRHDPNSPFRPEFETVFVGRERLRAIYIIGDRITMASVTSTAWDKRLDVAVFTMEIDDDEPVRFYPILPVTNLVPPVGEIVAVLSVADLSCQNYEPENGVHPFSVTRRTTLKVGRVTAHHPDGHLLCRGPCLQTTIPVFSGMSGGPALLRPQAGGKLTAFGLVSSDPDDDKDPKKRDRSVAGQSIMALLPIIDIQPDGDKRNVTLKLDAAVYGRDNDGNIPG